MTPHNRIVRKLRRLVVEAKSSGLALVADATTSTGAIRVMTIAEAGGDDIRELGEAVNLNGGCGGGVMPCIDPFGSP